MSTEARWRDISDELSQLSDNPGYKQYKPLLDNLQHMADARYPSPEIVKGVLDVVKRMQAQGTPAQEIVRKVEGGFVQPDWTVEGDVNQANRDLIKQTFITIVNNNIKELKEDEEENLNIPVPIVLLVMTKDEAQKLFNLEAFNEFTEQIYTEQFSRYHKTLQEKKLDNLTDRYGDSPEQWHPFRDDPITIRELITQALEKIEGYKYPLVPNFIDVRTLNEDSARRSLRNLRQNGCVVIIDSISIRHPDIQRAYRRTLLDAFPNTLLVKLNPFSDPSELEEQMVKFSERYLDLEFFKRFRVDLDSKCDEVEKNLDFQRWLLEQAPKILPEEEKAKKGWRKHAYR